MKEKWRNNCPTNSGSYRSPNLFYKNIGCMNWEKVKACDFDQNEFERGTKRVCNFSSPSVDYVRHAMMEINGK